MTLAVVPVVDDRAAMIDIARALLDGPAAPMAVLATSDEMALGAIEAARQLDLRVPEDLPGRRLRRHAVAMAADPSPTTVPKAHAAKGAAAVRMRSAMAAASGTSRSRASWSSAARPLARQAPSDLRPGPAPPRR